MPLPNDLSSISILCCSTYTHKTRQACGESRVQVRDAREVVGRAF